MPGTNLTGASSTPQPNRNPTSIPTVVRNAQESEKWDDLLAPIFKDQMHNDGGTWGVFGTSQWLRSTQVVMPVAGRIEVTGWWSPEVIGGSNLTALLSVAVATIVGGQANTAGSDSTSACTSTGGYINLFHNDAFDVNPGIYKVGTLVELLIGGAGSIIFGDSGMTARRGRKPTS